MDKKLVTVYDDAGNEQGIPFLATEDQIEELYYQLPVGWELDYEDPADEPCAHDDLFAQSSDKGNDCKFCHRCNRYVTVAEL